VNYQAWICSYKHVCLQLRIRNVRLCKTVCSGSDYCFANSYILQSHTRVYKMPSVSEQSSSLQFVFQTVSLHFFLQFSSVRISDRFLALLLAVLFSLSSVTFSHRFSFCSYSVSYPLPAVLNLIVFVLCLSALLCLLLL
jgi:hypothetical protein